MDLVNYVVFILGVSNSSKNFIKSFCQKSPMAYPYYSGTSTYANTYGESTFRGAIHFFEQLGIYDVVLPFLLIFSIVFAIFERTKVLGTEEIDGEKITKKNLNAIIAFVVSFLVIASARMVAIINEALPKIVILLFLGVFFLALVGIFYSEKEEVLFKKKGTMFFIVLVFISILLIFLHSIPTNTGEPFLYWLMRFIVYNFSTTAVSSLILITIVVFFMWFITRDSSESDDDKDDKH